MSVGSSMTKEQYISLAREDQIEVIIDHLLRQIDVTIRAVIL